MTATGWNYRTIDNLTLHEVTELTDYWNANPPVHLLVKAFIGYDNSKANTINEPDQNELEGLVNAFRTK